MTDQLLTLCLSRIRRVIKLDEYIVKYNEKILQIERECVFDVLQSMTQLKQKVGSKKAPLSIISKGQTIEKCLHPIHKEKIKKMQYIVSHKLIPHKKELINKLDETIPKLMTRQNYIQARSVLSNEIALLDQVLTSTSGKYSGAVADTRNKFVWWVKSINNHLLRPQRGDRVFTFIQSDVKGLDPSLFS